MKLRTLYITITALIFHACALNEPDVEAMTENFPYRLVIDEEGADLADAEDYGIEIGFADYLEELPSNEITLGYTLSGEGDFTGVVIDEILYEYEGDDCVFEREVPFTGNTMTIPVDNDLGTVPEKIEITVAFNLTSGEASEGGFELELTSIESAANVLLNDASTFEYEVLENDVAGEWAFEIASPDEFNDFVDVFGPVSSELEGLSFSDITGSVKLEFDFEEVKIEVELVETEEVTTCENGETSNETENLVVEIEAEYDAEDGEIEMEGSYFTDEGEELDFIVEAAYTVISDQEISIEFISLIDEDTFGDESLYAGSTTVNLIKD